MSVNDTPHRCQPRFHNLNRVFGFAAVLAAAPIPIFGADRRIEAELRVKDQIRREDLQSCHDHLGIQAQRILLNFLGIGLHEPALRIPNKRDYGKAHDDVFGNESGRSFSRKPRKSAVLTRVRTKS
jgi:hypothetical protein